MSTKRGSEMVRPRPISVRSKSSRRSKDTYNIVSNSNLQAEREKWQASETDKLAFIQNS